MKTPLRAKLKVFMMNDYDWWADYTLDDAINNYSEFINTDIEEAVEGPHEMGRKALNTIFFHDEERNIKTTFAQELLILQKPCFFASTES